MILFFSLTGVYLVSFNTVDMFIMVLIACISIVLRKMDFPMAPLLLGFILGGMMEENLSRALIISDGSLDFLWDRPISLVINLITVITLASPLILMLFKSKKKGLESYT